MIDTQLMNKMRIKTNQVAVYGCTLIYYRKGKRSTGHCCRQDSRRRHHDVRCHQRRCSEVCDAQLVCVNKSRGFEGQEYFHQLIVAF